MLNRVSESRETKEHININIVECKFINDGVIVGFEEDININIVECKSGT